MDIKNNTLYAFSQNKFVVQNLSSGTPVNISCSWSGSLKSVGRWTYNLGVDSSGSNLLTLNIPFSKRTGNNHLCFTKGP